MCSSGIKLILHSRYLIWLCVTDMKADLVSNQTNSKFFVKITRTKGFKNSKNLSQGQTRESIENKK
jgi:hypothetical protein